MAQTLLPTRAMEGRKRGDPDRDEGSQEDNGGPHSLLHSLRDLRVGLHIPPVHRRLCQVVLDNLVHCTRQYK